MSELDAVDFLNKVKEATKQGYLEAMLEYESYKREQELLSKEWISKRQAYSLFGGRSRVEALIKNPHLNINTKKSGDKPNSTQYLKVSDLKKANERWRIPC